MLSSLGATLRRHPSPRRLRTAPDARAVPATALLFGVLGVLLGSWASVVPAVSARVGVSHGELGLALLAMAAGALAGMQLVGQVCARSGAARTSLAGVGVASAAITLPALATTLPELGAALFVFGAATGGANVAVNALGVELQRRTGRPVMSQLHAGFSFGGLVGALAGGLAAGLLPTLEHLLLIGLAGLVASRVARGPLQAAATSEPAAGTSPEDDRAPRDPRSLRPLVVMLGAAAACTAVAEGAVTDWGSLHLQETLGAAPTSAAGGFAAFSLAMGCARLTGRRLVLRFADQRVLVGGAAVGAAGMLLAATAPTPAVAVLGFLLAGLGMANVFPLAIGRAGLLAGTSGVARASMVGYAGLLGGPPVIGALAQLWGLRAALGVVAVLVLAVAGLATAVERRLEGRRSVAAALRRQTSTQLRSLARAGGRSVRSHAASLPLLLDHGHDVVSPRPISDTFPY